MIKNHIEQISSALTWQLRRNELYPDRDYLDMKMPEDENGIHFGAFADNKIVGVVSLFNKVTDYEFREFAVSSSVLKPEIVQQLLTYISHYAITEGAIRLWCTTRVSEADFYNKNGFLPVGNVFEKEGKDYVRMERIFEK